MKYTFLDYKVDENYLKTIFLAVKHFFLLIYQVFSKR
jgi:hypothetical protein